MSTLTKTDNKDGWMDTVWSATKAGTEMMVNYAKDQPFNTILAIGTGLALSQKAWLLAGTMTAVAAFNTLVDTVLKSTIKDSSLYALKAVWKQSDHNARSNLIYEYILKPRGVDRSDVTQEEMDSMIDIMDKTLASM